jgi:hypothetical protein
MPEANKPRPIQNNGLSLVTEAMEAAFTVLMPTGWNNQANLQRDQSLNRIIASAVSPDGRTMIHLGDPRLPIFTAPSPYVDPSLMAWNPFFRMQPYTPADHFYHDYVRQCFGGAPGFRILNVAASPNFERAIVSDLQRSRRQAQVTSAAITFQHSGTGQALQCRLDGLTINFGPGWYTDLFITSTANDLHRDSELALRMMLSRYFNPQWGAAQQRLHEQRMALGQQQLQHINNMTELQRQGHQQRMQDIQNFGQANTRMHEERMAQSDANHQSWLTQQASSDAQHQSWMAQQTRDDAMQQSRINAIREEHTVVDSSGTAFQVDIHHERYFVNKRDNTYIGAGATTELLDLRRTHGVNPDDFEEVKVIR